MDYLQKSHKRRRFSAQDLWRMLIPLFREQFLVTFVGIADTFMISYCGEAAISGVSLVNQFNTIFIYIFTAISSGGAVIISQYIGNRDVAMANKASSQLCMFLGLLSCLTAILVLFGNSHILHLMFGRVESEVMDACVTYLRISAYSYLALGIYSAGASLYRSMGKTTATMYISVVSNLINVIGNCIGVFVLKAGVAGVAYPSLIARAVSAVWITILCFSDKQLVRYHIEQIVHWDGKLLCKILGIAIPNGIENGVFQIVKVMLSSIVALFGTYQIAANGVAQSIWSLAALSGVAMGPVFITVIGQCMGNREIEDADFYFRKLLKITVLLSAGWNVFILAATPMILHFFVLEEETTHLVFRLVLLHNVFNTFAFPFSGALGNGLRAAGDVKYTMYISTFTTVCVRLVLSYLLAVVMNLGVMGIAWAMCLDWTVRGFLFFLRMNSGKWKTFSII